MKIFAYFITTFIVPVFCIFIMQFIPLPSQYTNARILLETSIGGVLSIWLGTIVFALFGLQPTMLIAQLIGLFYFLNFFIGFFIKNESSEIATVKLLGGIGCLSGVILGGICFL